MILKIKGSSLSPFPTFYFWFSETGSHYLSWPYLSPPVSASQAQGSQVCDIALLQVETDSTVDHVGF